MKSITTTHEIQAPAELVFHTISDVTNFQNAIPGILEVEFLTEQQTGVGTRFLETREMHGKRQSVELEITEYQPIERVRMVSDAGGTIWDTVFVVRETGENRSQLDMKMDVKPYKLMARLFSPLILGAVGKAVSADMDSVKEYCERELAAQS